MRRLEDYFCDDPLGMLYNLEAWDKPGPKPKPKDYSVLLHEAELGNKAILTVEGESSRGPYRMTAKSLNYVRRTDLKEKGHWENVFRGHVLRLRWHKQDHTYILTDKRRRHQVLLAVKDEHELRHLLADMRKLHPVWHRHIKAKKHSQATI